MPAREEDDKWKRYWESQSEQASSDESFDRGSISEADDLDEYFAAELKSFINPQSNERVFDAGCGTGFVMMHIQPDVKSVTGMDFAEGAVKRCRERIRRVGIEDVEVFQGSVTAIPKPDRSFDKVLCLSVFQYLSESEVETALREFARILTPGGTLILHVKNLSSLYHASLTLAKQVKRVLGRPALVHQARTFGWYRRSLEAAGFKVVHYNSFNLLLLDFMPSRLVTAMRRLEVKCHARSLLKSGFLRRHGAELKIRAKLVGKVSPSETN